MVCYNALLYMGVIVNVYASVVQAKCTLPISFITPAPVLNM
jgi:hypothetical protein